MKNLSIAALILMGSTSISFADTYSVTVTNNLAEELIAPILVTGAGNDGALFMGTYVTVAAERQILTGDPAEVVKALGDAGASVGHGTDGPPGVLLAPGKSVTFDVETDATVLRFLAMVAPTMVPDNYVSAVVDVHAGGSFEVALDRYDIGNDEGTKARQMVAANVATVSIQKK